jgi:Transposase DDE domain
MSLYPLVPAAVPVSGGLVIAVRARDVASPSRGGRPAREEGRSALVIGGTGRIRTGDDIVVCKVVAVVKARVRRDGSVQAQGSPAEHATLGAAEEWLDEQAGPGVIDGIAERAALRPEFVKGERKRLLTRAFVIRAVVLMTLMPGAAPRDALIALAGDLALVPWARPWEAASERAIGDWRGALGPEPLEELAAVVQRAAHGEHRARDWRAVIIGKARPLKPGAIDGTLIRVPDTPANRAAFGSIGTGDDSSPYPQVRALPLTDASTRALLGMPYGPSSGDKPAGEQALLDTAMARFPHLFAKDRIWIMDRNFPGVARVAALTLATHFLIRLKSDVTLDKVSEILPDGSYLADLKADGTSVRVRVIEYYAEVEGQDVPEMFCLVTDLTDITEYPAPDLAGLYRWRWDGSETALREAKDSLRGSGPGTGPMLRSGTPGLTRQELAAWAAGTEMTRGAIRAAALAAAPARKGRRAGQPVRPRDLSHRAGRRVIVRAIQAGHAALDAVTREIARHRVVVDRGRHRPRKSKSPSRFPRGSRKTLAARTAPAVITMANAPA